jgi:hypothetical protein
MSEMENDDARGLSETDVVLRLHAESASETPPTKGEFPRETFLGLLRTGVWPVTAIAYLGVTRDEWRAARASDPQLTADTAKAIAAFELIHVRKLHEKIQEANDWRASAWWLAQRFPKRYGGGRTTKEAEKAVDDVLTVLDRALRREFSAPEDLGRLADVFGRVREERRE